MRRVGIAVLIALGAFAIVLGLRAIGAVERLELVSLDARYATGLGRKAPGDDIVIANQDNDAQIEQTYVFGCLLSVHPALEPLQLSATSHGPLAARHWTATTALCVSNEHEVGKLSTGVGLEHVCRTNAA